MATEQELEILQKHCLQIMAELVEYKQVCKELRKQNGIMRNALRHITKSVDEYTLRPLPSITLVASAALVEEARIERTLQGISRGRYRLGIELNKYNYRQVLSELSRDLTELDKQENSDD